MKFHIATEKPLCFRLRILFKFQKVNYRTSMTHRQYNVRKDKVLNEKQWSTKQYTEN